MTNDKFKIGCEKCHYTGVHCSEARHEDGSNRPSWAVQCECMKKVLSIVLSGKL